MTDDAQPVVAARLSSRDRHDYVARVRLAAERLVAQRYLRAEDVELVVGLAPSDTMSSRPPRSKRARPICKAGRYITVTPVMP